MRNKFLAIAAIAGAITVPVAAQAQSDTVGIVRGGSVIIGDSEGIAVEQRPGDRVLQSMEPMFQSFQCSRGQAFLCLRIVIDGAHADAPES